MTVTLDPIDVVREAAEERGLAGAQRHRIPNMLFDPVGLSLELKSKRCRLIHARCRSTATAKISQLEQSFTLCGARATRSGRGAPSARARRERGHRSYEDYPRLRGYRARGR
jgi:hypothetical protein